MSCHGSASSIPTPRTSVGSASIQVGDTAIGIQEDTSTSLPSSSQSPRERTKVMGLLEGTNSRIAVNTDMWTSNQKKGFTAITAHYIDDSWRLQSRILSVVHTF
ncbi:zinc finger BED domain-containing DAYSLEEPER-like [Olea europaea subsp. europaea]|uniref:Zinc finger BED domain-containing DAYSLEEPER-like n=1 Tax=Olea europaea subsp. europaea TaxID=158383 RepID=A0A8S0T0P0_OLEEU|nr:zinc finger BED domain-containing DAYSLEEPER-like [Olea europaea subsp. europaea]